MIEAEKITYYYLNKLILNNLSLKVQAGEIATLIGASGSGKTTLFRLLTGLISPDEGTFSINGEVTPGGHDHIAYMMQEDLLLPWRNVLGNLMLLGELGKNKKSPLLTHEEALNMLKEVGLEGCEEMWPEQLSGGMRQRVALARALLKKRPILLLDEPFGALDACLRSQLCDLLQKIRTKYGTTMLMITHDFRDATVVSDRIYLLANGTIDLSWSIKDKDRHDPIEMAHLQQTLYQALSNSCVIYS